MQGSRRAWGLQNKPGLSMASNFKWQTIAISACLRCQFAAALNSQQPINVFPHSLSSRRTVFSWFLFFLLRMAFRCRRTAYFARISRRTVYKRYLSSLREKQVKFLFRSRGDQHRPPGVPYENARYRNMRYRTLPRASTITKYVLIWAQGCGRHNVNMWDVMLNLRARTYFFLVQTVFLHRYVAYIGYSCALREGRRMNHWSNCFLWRYWGVSFF